jgi:hypothetical protein
MSGKNKKVKGKGWHGLSMPKRKDFIDGLRLNIPDSLIKDWKSKNLENGQGWKSG